jgi:hypothetical protein
LEIIKSPFQMGVTIVEGVYLPTEEEFIYMDKEFQIVNGNQKENGEIPHLLTGGEIYTRYRP